MRKCWIFAQQPRNFNSRHSPIGDAGSQTKHRLVVPTNQAAMLNEGGADYLAGFVSATEEQALVDAIDQREWATDLRRRVQHYGYRYDYKKRSVSEDDKIGPLPGWVSFLCERLVEQGIFDTPPDQLIVNEYLPGQGIAPHTDRDCFGPVVASVSLASDCMMDIYRNPADKSDVLRIVLERRSLLVLRGPAREQWLHGIRSARSDSQEGRRIQRERRLSLTFRTTG